MPVIFLFFHFSRNFSRSAILSDDDLPYHIVVGMPALSPTMETGTLSEWYLEEGSGFSAGESIAKIETDKASIDFEAQDDGYIGTLEFGSCNMLFSCLVNFVFQRIRNGKRSNILLELLIL